MIIVDSLVNSKWLLLFPTAVVFFVALLLGFPQIFNICTVLANQVLPKKGLRKIGREGLGVVGGWRGGSVGYWGGGGREVVWRFVVRSPYFPDIPNGSSCSPGSHQGCAQHTILNSFSPQIKPLVPFGSASRPELMYLVLLSVG